MSSHHFVKDKQEPALIIANGEECSNELLNQLLEWNPYVLVLDGALDRVLKKGIKVDAVLGDFDSISVNQLSVQAEQEIEWVYAESQHFTDLEKGLNFLVKNGHKAANIVWATGRRLDHSHNNLITLAKFSDKISLCMLDDFSRAFCLPKSYKKFYPEGSILSLLPITDVRGIQTSGLKYNLNKEDFILPHRTGSSNEVEQSGIVEIVFDDGILLLMECVD
ncbi:MAG: thiamine diphosphokinase [Flavobacteriales bacterium]|nr:thiamine diphosphokinase [Flavobacteriales bacterium]